MSLDISLKIDLLPTQEGEPERVYVFDENITHNLNRMASECGLYDCMWGAEDSGFTQASQLIEPLKKGIFELIDNKTKYLEFNPPNGWGHYDNLLAYALKLFWASKEYPEAKVRVRQ